MDLQGSSGMVRSPATRTLYGDQGSSGPDQEIRILASGSCNDRSLGDVHPLDVAETAAAYTPVPGGVGPLTIAMLMVNTIESAERRIGVTGL